MKANEDGLGVPVGGAHHQEWTYIATACAYVTVRTLKQVINVGQLHFFLTSFNH